MALIDKSVPGIPNVPTNLDPQTRAFLEKLKEAVEVRLGQRGDELDRSPTIRELFEGGAFDLLRGGRNVPRGSTGVRIGDYVLVPAPGVEYDPYADYSIPNPPSALATAGAMSTITLSWEGHDQRNVSMTEVWRSDVDDVETAELVGVTAGGLFADTVGPSSKYYYWVRFKTYTGVYSAWHGLRGVLGETADDPSQLLAILSGRLTETQLDKDLNSRIDLIDSEDGVLARLDELTETVEVDHAGQISAAMTEISQMQLTLDDNYAAIQTLQSVVGGPDGLTAQYMIKTDVNGRVAGYGLYNDGATSDFIVRADTFAVASPGATNFSFIVENGRVVIDGAAIKRLSVTNAQIANVNVDKITGAVGNFVVSNIGAGKITNAMIGDTIQSDNYVPGVSGWIIKK